MVLNLLSDVSCQLVILTIKLCLNPYIIDKTLYLQGISWKDYGHTWKWLEKSFQSTAEDEKDSEFENMIITTYTMILLNINKSNINEVNVNIRSYRHHFTDVRNR